MQVKLPHNFTPRDYQLPFLRAMDSGINRAVIVWNRRAGKDKTCFNLMIKKSFERIGTYFYFLPTYSQAKKVIWDNIDSDGFKMLDHIPKEIIKNTNATELKIELKNGSMIQLIAADEFSQSGIGTNPIGVVFSEYSVTDPNAWKYVSPILASNGGWAIFNFTPRGMNHAFTLLQQAKENPKWFAEVLTLTETKTISLETLEEEKKGNPQDLIEQEYYCKFIEGASAFFRRVTENVYDAQDERIDPFRRYKMGVDLGKHQDYTVITILDLMTFKVHKQDRFNQIDWNLQKAKIEASYLKHFKPLIDLDSSGLGDPIYDDLINKGIGNINSRKFTEQLRRDLLVNLQLLLEQDKIKIPDDPILLNELQSFRYELMGVKGKTRIEVPEGLHDDCVFSLALACFEIPQNPLPTHGSLRFMNKITANESNNTDYR